MCENWKPPDMPTITIDGRSIEAHAGQTIIQAARDHGIDIPHFCWHPKLSVAGNCRICLVEVEKAPKLVIACSTQVADGMVVQTNNPRVVDARQAVMEFLLINHPLDCPICDEAGECKLQDYAYKYSVGYSRFEEDKVHKPKRVELGPHVLLDMERCIMCSRCVRFCDEIAGKPQLTFTQRGDHVVLTTYPAEQLDNPYSMNTIDICPVGALTSRDFRFKARVWEMSATETICPGCSRGCNILAWTRNNEILRLTPRLNPEVNEGWMCDHGRLSTFGHVGAGDRVKAPMVKKDAGLVEVGWDEALAVVASQLKAFRKSEVAVLVSPQLTNEDAFMVLRLAREVLGTKQLAFRDQVVEGDEDDLLIRADKSPNSRGLQELGIASGKAFAGILQGIREGTIRALIVAEENLAALAEAQGLLARLELLVVCSSNENATTANAEVVLPASTFAEKNGTFTNFEGQVQRIRPAVATLDRERSLDGYAMSRMDKFGSQFDRWAKGPKRDARPTWRIVAGIISAMGPKSRYNSSEEVFNELASSIAGYKGMTYRKLGNRGKKLNLPQPVRSTT